MALSSSTPVDVPTIRNANATPATIPSLQAKTIGWLAVTSQLTYAIGRLGSFRHCFDSAKTGVQLTTAFGLAARMSNLFEAVQFSSRFELAKTI